MQGLGWETKKVNPACAWMLLCGKRQRSTTTTVALAPASTLFSLFFNIASDSLLTHHPIDTMEFEQRGPADVGRICFLRERERQRDREGERNFHRLFYLALITAMNGVIIVLNVTV